MILRGLLSSVQRFALVIATLGALPMIVYGQVQATTGVVRGTTTDSSGTPVSAVVTVRNTGTNFTRTLKASERGVFVATLLPLGAYEVTARAVGYSPETKSNLIVKVGQSLEVPLILARAATQLTGVTVKGQTPTVDPTRS